MAWVKRKLNQARRTITAFCCVFIDDLIFSPHKMVLLVDNNSDADMARARGDQVLYDKKGKERGKPGKWGLPGGGAKADDFGSPEEAAMNELHGESGFNVRSKPLRDFLDPQPTAIILDRKGNIPEDRRPIPFEKGKRPANIELRPGETCIENWLYTFEARVDWESSRLRKILVEYKNRVTSRLEDPISEESIAYYGIWIWLDNLDLESVLKNLGVNIDENVDQLLIEKGLQLTADNRRMARAAKYLDIEEFNEIRGIGIFPIKTLLGEIRDTERGSFYPSHLMRIEKGLEQKGILDTIMGAE